MLLICIFIQSCWKHLHGKFYYFSDRLQQQLSNILNCNGKIIFVHQKQCLSTFRNLGMKFCSWFLEMMNSFQNFKSSFCQKKANKKTVLYSVLWTSPNVCMFVSFFFSNYYFSVLNYSFLFAEVSPIQICRSCSFQQLTMKKLWNLQKL